MRISSVLASSVVCLAFSAHAAASDACAPKVVTDSKQYDLGPDLDKRYHLPFPGKIEGSLTVESYSDRLLQIRGHSLMDAGYTPTVTGNGGHLCHFGVDYSLRMAAQRGSCVFLPIERDSAVLVHWDFSKAEEGEKPSEP